MLKTIAKFSLISLLLCQLSHAASYKPKLIDRIDVKYPGFVSFIPSTVKGSYHLAITAFNGAPLTSDHVYYVANYTGTSHDQIVELSHTNVLWPNEATFTNETIISDNIDPFGGVLVPSGFLVPTKEDGGLFYYPFATADRSIVRSQPPIELSTKTSSKNTYFYHRLKFVDLSGDGKVDLLTCRTHKPVIGSTKTQLVGYVLNEASLVFEEKLVLNEACDVFFEVADIDSDGRFEIIAAGYFIQKLNLIYSDDPENSFLTGKVQVKAIDTTGGKFFDVKASDLDLDKSTFELLVTNHQGNKDTIKSSLFYYKLTGGNLRTGNWSRTTIYDNFPVLKQGIQQASPGAARTLYPLTNSTKSTRPYILVAGDGAEYLYLFEPSPIGQELSYNLTWSQDFMDTVGGISIADINNDGVNEFAVAVYEKNACFVFTLVSD